MPRSCKVCTTPTFTFTTTRMSPSPSGRGQKRVVEDDSRGNEDDCRVQEEKGTMKVKDARLLNNNKLQTEVPDTEKNQPVSTRINPNQPE